MAARRIKVNGYNDAKKNYGNYEVKNGKVMFNN